MTQHKGSPIVDAAMILPATILAPNLVVWPETSEPINTDIADHLRPATRDSALKSKGGAVPSAG
jgi:hypothetical protein